ncbi:MAG TPA: hypothetical protein DDY29_04805 [Rhodobacteraceae bacterium]|jgi:uncharacterized protein (TIGR02186 family)|nr:TIGR02186 family protein [Paracoccaceae bacterium]HBG98059.1 hypothetical protein [Paracoccaceae bacterium]
MMRAVALLLVLLAALSAAAEERVVVGLSEDAIAISTDFTGSELLIFGAIKRAAPPPPGRLDVIVTLAGPSERVVVRRKARKYGIWVNDQAVEVDAAPSFYAVATTRLIGDILPDTQDLRHRITTERMIRAVGLPDDILDRDAFIEALVRLREAEGLYGTFPGAVTLREATLFRTDIAMPANLVEGAYALRIFLMRDGEVVDLYETDIAVEKVGLERWLYTLAHERPFRYALLSLFIAIAAGWLASAAFRLLPG